MSRRFEVDGHATRLLGFDDQGTVYDNGEHILRSIRPEFSMRLRNLVSAAERHNFDAMGVVPTRIRQPEPLVLEHQKYVISYPHEWPSEMMRRACLFHLNLARQLQAVGFDLKDALPNNIAFDGPTPRFIDFPSVVASDQLVDLDWLVASQLPGEDLRSTVIRTMLLPYFFVPLLAMESGQLELGRMMLRDRSCQVGLEPPSLAQILAGASHRERPKIWLRALRLAVIRRSTPAHAHRHLERLLLNLHLPHGDGYSNYYAEKDEEFALDDSSSWLPKQRAISDILDRYQPATVLDLGSNTGWFSRLACHRGARVLAIDIDEASLNDLFLTAERDHLAITPLRLAFSELQSETRVRGPRYNGEVAFQPATSRLKSDLTLMLGLLHHLTLGEGRSIESVMATLAALANETLVLEFVGLQDELVVNNPGYFRRLEDWTSDTYNAQRVVQAASPHFTLDSRHASHPDSREILTFRRRR